MTEIVYDVSGLIINVYYDKFTRDIKWSIQSKIEVTPTFNSDQIETIISQLEKSLDYNWEKKS